MILVILLINIGKIFGSKYLVINNIVGIPHKYIEINKTANLNFFYEPIANTTEGWKPEWLPYKAKNTINADSLNEIKNYLFEKPKNTFRIITLGDSWVYGHYVNTEDNYSKQLERSLNLLNCKNIKHFEIINLGVYGYDIEYAVTRFNKRGLKYNPDLVIWLVNDWNFGKINEQFLPYFYDLLNKGKKAFETINGSFTHPASDKAYSDIQNKLGKQFIINYQEKAMMNIIDIYQGDILLFSYVLNDSRFSIEKLVKTNPDKIKYFPGSNKLEKDKQKYLLSDGHPNKEGHEKIAQDLKQYLMDKYLKQCKS